VRRLPGARDRPARVSSPCSPAPRSSRCSIARAPARRSGGSRRTSTNTSKLPIDILAGIAAVPGANRSGHGARRGWPESGRADERRVPRPARAVPLLLSASRLAQRSMGLRLPAHGSRAGTRRCRDGLAGRRGCASEAPALRRFHVDVLVAAHVAGVVPSPVMPCTPGYTR
jgi:hypothetical protein